MAINVNTVYQTVLFILNKEQRGYMTPAEFNSLANQVQLEILDKYFEDLNLFLRQANNSTEYANKIKTVEEKIAVFERQSTTTNFDLTQLTRFYKLGTVTYVGTSAAGNNPFGPEYPTVIEEITQGEFNLINKSPLTRPSANFPVFTIRNHTLQISPNITEVTINYLRKPADVVWAYQIGTLGQYIYEGTVPPPAGTVPASGSVNFELSELEQTEVILRILQYAGIIIRDPQIIQTASSLIQQDDQIEKT
jgi:hypothetical protein